MSVAVYLHLWMLGKRKNAVCVGVQRVGVACQSWLAGAAVRVCGAAFAAAVMLHVHTWLCMYTPGCACAHLAVPVHACVSPCPCHGARDGVAAAVPRAHMSMSKCGHL